MKTNYLIFAYLLIFAALLTGGCDFWEKDPLIMELPPITEEGKNTFGCMIEDEVYVPQIRRMVMATPSSDIYVNAFPKYPYYKFYVSTQRVVSEKDTAMDAEVDLGNMGDSIRTIGTYTLWASVRYNGNYYQALPNTNSLMIAKFDSINGIISGQFDFQAIKLRGFIPIDIDDPDFKIITISNGRFDLRKGSHD